MESTDILMLHRECVETLKKLISAANRTCSLLEAMTDFPINLDLWNKALEQRLAENAAQEQYQHARERLFAAIKPSAEFQQ